MRLSPVRRSALLVAFLAAFLVAVPAYAHDYYYWTAHPQEKVYPATSVPAARGTSGSPSVGIAIGAARAEFEGRQLAIRPTGTVRDVWLQPSELVMTDASGTVTARIPATEVSTYKVDYVPITRPSTGYKVKGSFPDPLLPMTLANGQRLGWQVGGGMDVTRRAVGANTTQPFYVLFHVPKTAAAGTYRGSIRVTCTGDDGIALPALDVPVSLTVYDFSVERQKLKTLFQINLKWAGEAASNVHSFLGKDTDVDGEDRVYEGTTFKADQYRGWFEYMNDHRIVPNTMIPAWENGSDWMPPNDQGNMVARRSYLDDYLETGAATTFSGDRFAFNTVTIPDAGMKGTFASPFSTAARKASVAQYLRTMTQQLGSYVSRAYVYAVDEPSGTKRAFIEQYAAFSHQNAPGAKFMVTTAGNIWDWKPLKGVDAYVQRLHFYYRDYSRWVKPLRKAGKEVWIYSHATTWQAETPGFMIDGPLTDPRAQGWFAYHSSAPGLLYYSVNQWQNEQATYRDPYKYTVSAENSVLVNNGDGSLLYPGFYPAKGLLIQGSPPVGSLRMEALRDGFEDHEYLSVLEDRAGRATADYYVGRIIGKPTTVRSGGSPTFPSYPKRASSYEAVRGAIAHRLGGATSSQQIAGADRYVTAIRASQTGFASAPCVVIATGANWPDALGGAALAAAEGGPILLTPQKAMPAEVIAEIRRLKATRAIVLGGGAAVSGYVERQLNAVLGDANVTRVGGRDRYETAERVARAAVERRGGFDGTAFVATGANFPDALAASPLSAARGWPILLVPRTGMTPSTRATLAAIGTSEVLVLGGGGAVPGAVENSLVATYGRAKVTRLAGPDRYVTGVVVANAGVTRANLTYDGLALATGADFPDALAGGVLQGKAGSVLLLTPKASLNPTVRQAVSAQRSRIRSVRFLGGTSALGVAPREQLYEVLN